MGNLGQKLQDNTYAEQMMKDIMRRKMINVDNNKNIALAIRARKSQRQRRKQERGGR